MNPSSIRIVLVGTTHPGNIGSTARAMKTMGFADLRLVAPERFPDPLAEANAGKAADVLESARVHGDLPPALQGAGLVLGLTARRRRIGAPSMDPRQAAAAAARESDTHPVALVFGRERSGLTNEELGYCHGTVHIPTSAGYPSLNLAAAVQVMTYELRASALQGGAAEEPPLRPAPAEHLEGFYEHLFHVVELSGYASPDGMVQLRRRLRRLFNRARPEQEELNLLRGLLTAVERGLRKRG